VKKAAWGFGLVVALVVFSVLRPGAPVPTVSQRGPQGAPAPQPEPTGPVSGTVELQKAPLPVASSALEAARIYIEAHRAEWKLQPHHQLRVEESRNPLGTKLRFAVYQGKYPVLGAQIQMRVDGTNRVREVHNGYTPVPAVDVESSFAGKSLGAKLADGSVVVNGSPAAQVIYVSPGSSEGIAALAVTVRTAEGLERQALVRASDGQVLNLSVPRSEFQAYRR